MGVWGERPGRVSSQPIDFQEIYPRPQATRAPFPPVAQANTLFITLFQEYYPFCAIGRRGRGQDTRRALPV